MWIAKIKKDTDNDKIGTVSAVWTDPDDLNNVFVYTVRVDRTTSDSVNQFVTNAKSALTDWQSKKSTTATQEQTLADKLNT